ncbi:MAG: peptide deformylase [Elusimicrobiota bacterium]
MNDKIFKVVTYPNEVLRAEAHLVDAVTDYEREVLDAMYNTMRENNGVGLAAPQVGISLRLIVIDVGDGPIFLANPVIVEKKGKDELKEGCLSLPGAEVKVYRAKHVVVKGLDRDNKHITIKAKGLLARAVQHETDHLDGKLIIDYMENPLKF